MKQEGASSWCVLNLRPLVLRMARGEPHALLIAAVEEVDSFEFGFHACFFPCRSCFGREGRFCPKSRPMSFMMRLPPTMLPREVANHVDNVPWAKFWSSRAF